MTKVVVARFLKKKSQSKITKKVADRETARQREMIHQQCRLQKGKSVWPPLPEQSAPGYYSNECNRKTDVIYL